MRQQQQCALAAPQTKHILQGTSLDDAEAAVLIEQPHYRVVGAAISCKVQQALCNVVNMVRVRTLLLIVHAIPAKQHTHTLVLLFC
jgi:hypothetical protein